MSGPAMAAAAAQIAMEAGEMLKNGGMALGADLPSDGVVRPTKLFIGGISRRTTTKQLRDHFSKCGRVLDCVAMRQPDGRPRGFGYVTLDSPAAAQYYLSEPQMIDNRYVDLKPAVPDASMVHEASNAPYSWPAQEPARLHLDAQDRPSPFATTPAQRLSAPGLCLPIMGTPAWHLGDGALDFENASPLSILTRQAIAAPATPPAVADRGAEQFSQFGGLFSRPVPPTESLCLREVAPAKVQLPSVLPSVLPHALARPAMKTKTEDKVPSAKVPLREVTNMPLREVTNLLDDAGMKRDRRDGLKPTEAAKPRGLAPRDLSMPSPAAPFTPALPKEDSFFILADDDIASPPVPVGRLRSPSPAPSAADSEQSAGSSTRPSAASASEGSPHGVLSPCEGLPLPTVGSAKHASGECRRCNFFAKGRCRNGYDCSFCHFPHDRRKLSRQEKREAKLQRLVGKQHDSPGSEPASEPTPAGASPFAGAEDSDFTPLVVKAAALTSPFAGAEEEESETSFVAPPPGLAAPDFSNVALPPGLAPPGLPPPPHLEAFVQPKALTKAPPSWTAGAAGSPLSTSSPGAKAPAPMAVETRTIGTQTEEDYPCCIRCARINLA